MYIAIAGNIGSGKTTLTQILTERYGAKAYLEQTDNPYLGDFYEDMNRWSFNLQISFLGSRIQQTMEMLAETPDIVFQDRTIYEDAHIFAGNLHEMGLMSSRDIETYMKIFHLVTHLIPQPDLLIYLKASVPTLISQIRKRGREYEMNIDEAYLQRLNVKYDRWIEENSIGSTLSILILTLYYEYVKEFSLIHNQTSQNFYFTAPFWHRLQLFHCCKVLKRASRFLGKPHKI